MVHGVATIPPRVQQTTIVVPQQSAIDQRIVGSDCFDRELELGGCFIGVAIGRCKSRPLSSDLPTDVHSGVVDVALQPV
jgi:hypothetical protein